MRARARARPRRQNVGNSRSASQLPRAADAEICERLFGELVKSACFCVPLDLFVEARSVKSFEARLELGELIRGQFGQGLSKNLSICLAYAR